MALLSCSPSKKVSCCSQCLSQAAQRKAESKAPQPHATKEEVHVSFYRNRLNISLLSAALYLIAIDTLMQLTFTSAKTCWIMVLVCVFTFALSPPGTGIEVPSSLEPEFSYLFRPCRNPFKRLTFTLFTWHPVAFS